MHQDGVRGYNGQFIESENEWFIHFFDCQGCYIYGLFDDKLMAGQTYEAIKANCVQFLPGQTYPAASFSWYHVESGDEFELFSPDDFEDYFMSEAETRKLKLEQILKNY